ncbi:MAG: hypothetical protein O2816_14250, partial [Planctomycetota bacterium]|nr:hypothetical protein [Planctomycetota bacterium]
MRILLTPLAAFAVCGPALADDIYLTDGKTISSVSVKAETLKEVEYRDDKNKAGSVSSSKVLSIAYSEKPQAVDQADASIAQDQFVEAEARLFTFLEEVSDRVPSKHPWSRAYAMYRLATVYGVMGDVERLGTLTGEMLSLEPDSRYLPLVLSKRAEVLFDSGEKGKALSSLSDLEKLIEKNSLGEQWQLELDLGKVIYGSSTGAAQRKGLEALSARAGVGYPVARNRAEVMIGASWLTEAKLHEAEKIFAAVVADPKADDRTLAAAYSGLGQCLFRRGERDGDADLLQKGLMAYMRVVVLYKNEVAYLPESLFFAGRCYQLIGGDTA